MKRAMTNKSWFDFQPVFPCSLRSPTGIAHSARVPGRRAGSSRFFRDGGVGLLAPLCRRRQHGTKRRATRARVYPARGDNRNMIVPLGADFYGWVFARPNAQIAKTTKKPVSRGISAPGLFG